MNASPLSKQLGKGLKDGSLATLGDLDSVLEERSFAVLILFLMLIPSLPLPTGGVTHVFEVISMLLSLEMIIGMRTVWLPKRWRRYKLGLFIKGKALPVMVRRVEWFERFSNRSRWRLDVELHGSNTMRLIGALLLVLSLAAFLAPPFTGLDTLPSLAAVCISLAVILSDGLLLIAGILIGVIGVILEISLGDVVIKAIKHLFRG